MAFIWTEKLGDWQLSEKGATCVYWGESDDPADTLALARTDLSAIAAASFGGIARADIEAREVGNGKFIGTVTFGKNGGGTRPKTGEARISGNTKGGTIHITQALEHIEDHAPSGATAPNFQGAIGVDQDGNVAGCDVPSAAFDFEITRYVADANFTTAYLGRIAVNSAHTNDAYFTVTVEGKTLDFSEQSCVYYGCTWSKRQAEGDWEVVMSFSGSPMIDVDIGTIPTFTKLGWHYVWTRYTPDVDLTAGVHIMRPASAHVERVLHKMDFAALDP